MVIAHFNERIAALAWPLLLSIALGGCATSADLPLIDARAQALAPPKTGVYLPVQDLPPKRETPAMTVDEMSKLKKDLSAARDRQSSRAKAREGVAPAHP
jgi:hypothetical protein